MGNNSPRLELIGKDPKLKGAPSSFCTFSESLRAHPSTIIVLQTILRQSSSGDREDRSVIYAKEQVQREICQIEGLMAASAGESIEMNSVEINTRI